MMILMPTKYTTPESWGLNKSKEFFGEGLHNIFKLFYEQRLFHYPTNNVPDELVHFLDPGGIRGGDHQAKVAIWRHALPSFSPVKPIVLRRRFPCNIQRLEILGEPPLVLMAARMSPGFPRASTWREKENSKDESFPMAVRMGCIDCQRDGRQGCPVRRNGLRTRPPYAANRPRCRRYHKA